MAPVSAASWLITVKIVVPTSGSLLSIVRPMPASLSQISRDADRFDVKRIISGINEKLIRRHPHVFGDKADLTESELRRQWARIKESEKNGRDSS